MATCCYQQCVLYESTSVCCQFHEWNNSLKCFVEWANFSRTNKKKKQNQLGTDLGIFSIYWLPVEWVTTATSHVDHI